jgi:hypothetical protein
MKWMYTDATFTSYMWLSLSDAVLSKKEGQKKVGWWMNDAFIIYLFTDIIWTTHIVTTAVVVVEIDEVNNDVVDVAVDDVVEAEVDDVVEAEVDEVGDDVVDVVVVEVDVVVIQTSTDVVTVKLVQYCSDCTCSLYNIKTISNN